MTAREKLRHLVDAMPEDAAALLAEVERWAAESAAGCSSRTTSDVAAGVQSCAVGRATSLAAPRTSSRLSSAPSDRHRQRTAGGDRRRHGRGSRALSRRSPTFVNPFCSHLRCSARSGRWCSDRSGGPGEARFLRSLGVRPRRPASGHCGRILVLTRGPGVPGCTVDDDRRGVRAGAATTVGLPDPAAGQHDRPFRM